MKSRLYDRKFRSKLAEKPGAMWIRNPRFNSEQSQKEKVIESNSALAEPSMETSNDSNTSTIESSCDSFDIQGCVDFLPEGSDLDPTALAALPADMRNELIEQEFERLQVQNSEQDMPCTDSSNMSNSQDHMCFLPEGSNLDPAVLADIPADIRNEIIQQEIERIQRENPEGVLTCMDGTFEEERSTKLRSRRDDFSSTSTAGEKYKGEVDSFGKKHGKGFIRWENGATFKGTFQHGLRHGLGTLIFADGSSYSGHWKDDQFSGCGRRTFPNGCTYTGKFERNKCNGYGHCSFPNGDSYIGHWKDGLMHGHGTITHMNGDVYEGMYCCNKRHGPGTYALKDGKVDMVRYEEGVRKGYGVRWSHNKRKAWLLNCTEITKKISVKDAHYISNKILDGNNCSVDEYIEHHIPCKGKKLVIGET